MPGQTTVHVVCDPVVVAWTEEGNVPLDALLAPLVEPVILILVIFILESLVDVEWLTRNRGCWLPFAIVGICFRKFCTLMVGKF